MARVEDVAEGALRGNRPTWIVGGRNWLMAQSVRFVPRSITARMGAGLLRPPRVRPAT